MKTFDDLKFEQRDELIDTYFSSGNESQAVLFFKNGYGVSVLFGKAFYSNGVNNYELAVLKGEEKNNSICYDTNITNDVLGYLSQQEVTKVMKKVQQL